MSDVVVTTDVGALIDDVADTLARSDATLGPEVADANGLRSG
jgi:hypothetical protein